MAGIPMDRGRLTLQGLPGDRMYAFVRTDRVRPFPWLTMREFPGMAAWTPEWRPTGSGRDELHVRTPSGATLPVTDPGLEKAIATTSGLPVRLHADYRGNPDVAPLSIISVATVAAICERAGLSADPRRFRMNLVIDGLPAFGEDEWLGAEVRVGTARLAIVARDERCAVITVNPDGSEDRQPLVLDAVANLNHACAGVYAVVLEAGEVALGDALVVDAAS